MHIKPVIDQGRNMADVGRVVSSSQLLTEVPEIQDVQGPKSIATPPTAQTSRPNWLKYVMEALQLDSFRGEF